MEHVDPYKEANAQKLRLASNTTTLAYEYARQGRDWEEELHQIAREKTLMRELGLGSDDLNKNNPSATENKANG
jgi:capsid protein